MSVLTEHRTTTAGTGAAGLLLAAGVAVWRLGIEFERGWLRSLAAPPEQFELDAVGRTMEAIRATSSQRAAPAFVPSEPIAA